MSSNKIHFANHLTQDVHIFVSPNKDWVLADFLTDIGTMFIDGYGMFNSTKDIWKILYSMKFISSEVSTGLKFTEFFKKHSYTVKPGGECKISDKSTSNPLKYLDPSGWAAIFNGKDVTLIVSTDDFKTSIQFNSNSDKSWIASTRGVVRAKYGTINTEDPHKGLHKWRLALPKQGNFKGKPILHSNHSLPSGQSLASANGLYELTMQNDGNLVIYDYFRKVLWASNTDLKGGKKLAMQNDGNLVIYTPKSKPVWSTRSDGKGGVKLAMQDDGNLVIYTKDGKPVWSTGTYK